MTGRVPMRIKPRFLKLIMAITAFGLNFTLAQASIYGGELRKPAPRQGYYFGASGLAALGTIYTDDTNWVGPMGGPIGSLHVGQGLNEHLAIGVHLGAGTLYSAGRKSTTGNVSIELKWSMYKELFLRASIGFGFMDSTRTEGGLIKIFPDVGASYYLSAGYDLFPFYQEGKSGGVGVTPIIWANGMNATNLSYLAGGIGIEFTWNTGLKKNRLILPDDAAYE